MNISGKIKVLECIRQGKIGGGESHLLSLIENIDQSKFSPLVLSFTDGPMIERLKGMKIGTSIIHTEKPFNFFIWSKVKSFLKREKVDLVHAHGTRANSNVLWAARSLGIPVIYTIHGWSFHPDQNAFVKKIRILGEKFLTSRSTINISVSASNQHSGKAYINSFKSVIVNNGIDVNKFSPDKKHNDIRKELGIPDKITLILFLARFTLQKQPMLLIKAFEEALKINPSMHLLMVGDGEQKTMAEEFIKKSGMVNKITLWPFRQDVPDVLASADIFVLPSLWEGLPIGLLEAMAMGKAVLASNADGTSEIIKHEENGLLMDIKEMPKAMPQLLAKLSLNNNLKTAIGNKARETVQYRFNAQKMTKEIENIYFKIYNQMELYN